jgi:predicted nucleotidyltransferase component of viral defense system
MYREKTIRRSELLQLVLLDNLYAESGSERIIFQGGTALRWVYGGMRFSEDLDFVTQLPAKEIEKIVERSFAKAQRACVAQFGLGRSEYRFRGRRGGAASVFFIYRPETQRERIAVKLEFETLKPGHQPDLEKKILRDLPSVVGMISNGELIMPYSSSIILAETIDEILSDKIRALYERKYLKGRDFYDLWWIVNQLKVTPDWIKVREKLFMYQAHFIPAREADYFLKSESDHMIRSAIETDLPRFIPQNIFSKYQENDFSELIATLRGVTSDLLSQGMEGHFEDYGRTKGYV